MKIFTDKTFLIASRSTHTDGDQHNADGEEYSPQERENAAQPTPYPYRLLSTRPVVFI
jgi:hypothetical protein